MQIYLVAFAFHIALLYLSARIGDKRVGLVLAIISVLPLCVVAGARDITVGTDTSAYPLSCFNASQVYSPIGALSACSDQEPIFVLLFWFLGRLTGDFNAVLFFCEVIIFLPYVLVAKKQFPQGYPVIGFFLCFIVFGYTLNILRQCLATSMLVLMVYELIHGKNLPAFVFLAIAVGFHKMSIVGIFVWVIYIACCESRGVRSSKTLAMLFCFGIAVCAVSAVLNTPGGRFDGLQLPLEDFWDKEFHFKEMARSVEMLHEVQYTNDKSLLFPKLIRNCENGWIEADLNTLGIHKATAWSYQNEWRYVLTAVPVGIASVIKGDVEAVKRATEVILDRCDPEIPSFYDLIISDEAFSSMKLVASPKMTPGNRVILDALVQKYAPGIEVAKSTIELS